MTDLAVQRRILSSPNSLIDKLSRLLQWSMLGRPPNRPMAVSVLNKEDVMRCVRCVWFAAVWVFLTVGATVAAAENISGTLSVTRVIVEDSQLVGDVTCTMTTAPCIQFGAPNIALRLNGFTITGPANP